MSQDLIEHRREDYPEGMYRQPRDRFWHNLEWSLHCALCEYDREEAQAVERMDDEAALGGFDIGGEG